MNDGQGGAVGIELTLTTSLSDDVRTSRGGPEAWQALQVGVFHRSSSTIRLGDENYFYDSAQGVNVRIRMGGWLSMSGGPILILSDLRATAGPVVSTTRTSIDR